MRKHIRISLISILAVGSLPAPAQFNQSISVEGKYVPEVFRLDRINSFPKQVKFSLETNPLSYDGKSVPAAFTPTLLPMPATGWNTSREFSTARGYIDLGAGSWLNSTLSAGYRFIDNRSTTLGIRLQHNSTSLWKPQLSTLAKDTKMERYDESIAVFGSHDFNDMGKLSGSLDYHIGNFNYYGYDPQNLTAESGIRAASSSSDPRATKAPTQTLNDIAARFLWESHSSPGKLSWFAGAGVRYFGYRGYYYLHNPGMGAPVADKWSLNNTFGSRETDININGGFNLPLASGSSFGVDMNTDIVAYAHPEARDGAYTPWQPETYALLTLTPYYRFSRERLLVRVGADIDLAFCKRNDLGGYYAPFGFLHVAPDVRVDYLAGPVSLYFHALGGTSLHTLASNYDLDYYQTPNIASERPVYSPLDGSLGATFGPFSGFSAGIDLAFRITRGQHIGGWYMAAINNVNSSFIGLPTQQMIDGIYRNLYYPLSDADIYNLKGISLGARLSYDAGKIFKIEGKGNFQPQNGETGYFNGYDRPRWTAGIAAETNPWKGLKFRLAYEYRGVRNIYAMAHFAGSLSSDDRTLTACRLPDLTLLNFGVSYTFTPAFSIWGQADNLLNRHDILLPCLPSQGITASAGLSLTF